MGSEMCIRDRFNEACDWLSDNSDRPQMAKDLLRKMLAVIRTDTGEIMASRKDLADMVDTAPDNITHIMADLKSIGVIHQERHPLDKRKVRYFMNTTVATHLPEEVRRPKQREDGPLLKIMNGGKS